MAEAGKAEAWKTSLKTSPSQTSPKTSPKTLLPPLLLCTRPRTRTRRVARFVFFSARTPTRARWTRFRVDSNPRRIPDARIRDILARVASRRRGRRRERNPGPRAGLFGGPRRRRRRRGVGIHGDGGARVAGGCVYDRGDTRRRRRRVTRTGERRKRETRVRDRGERGMGRRTRSRGNEYARERGSHRGPAAAAAAAAGRGVPRGRGYRRRRAGVDGVDGRRAAAAEDALARGRAPPRLLRANRHRVRHVDERVRDWCGGSTRTSLGNEIFEKSKDGSVVRHAFRDAGGSHGRAVSRATHREEGARAAATLEQAAGGAGGIERNDASSWGYAG